MREIKFRARRKVTGTEIRDFMEEYGLNALQSDLFIVEQFTGLLDSQGREIYEGDIVVMRLVEAIVVGCVVYSGCGFVISTGDVLWDIDNYVSISVTGNRHEHPEYQEAPMQATCRLLG